MKRIAFFACLFFTGTVWSQEDRTDTTELMPVEVRATRAGSRAPFTKTNLNKSAIEQKNLGQDLPFLLQTTPSVIVHSDAGNGVGYTGIRIRGADPTRINVTLNGIPYNDAESQGTFFVNLPDFASSANSIQIQRGVGTSSNGAGAFGGTVNISTNASSEKPYAAFNNSYGSFNTLKNTLRLGTGILGDGFSADVRLSNISSDGYIDRASSDLKSYYFSTAYKKNGTELRFNTFYGKEQTYQAWNGVSEIDLKNNRRVNYAGTEKSGAPYDNETDNYQQHHYQLFFTQRFKQRFTFHTGLFYVKGSGYYEQYKAGEAYEDYGLPSPVFGTEIITETDLVRQLWLDNEFYGNVFSLLYQTPKTEATLGGAVSKYIGNHFGDVTWAQNGLPSPTHRWYNHDAWKNDATVYGKWQQQVFPYWHLYTDVQLRAVRYRIDGFRDNPDLHLNNHYLFLNPKAGISYNRNNLQWYASYGKAQKEPNRDDFEAGADQLPKPEKLHDFEMGLEKRSGDYNWSAVVYYMRYVDQLVMTGKINDVGAYTRTNVDNSYRLGVELQGAAKLNSWINVSANLALSRNKVLDFTEYVDDYDNGGQKSNQYSETDIAFSPRIVGAAELQIKPLPQLQVNFVSKYVGKQYLDNTQNEQRWLNDYYTQDVQLRYTIANKWVQSLELITQANNVFNKLYEPNGYTYSYWLNKELVTENYYYPMAGFNWMLGLNIRL